MSLCSGVTLLERALYILNRIRTFDCFHFFLFLYSTCTFLSLRLPFCFLIGTVSFRKKKDEKKYRCDITDTIDRLIAGQPINFDFTVADCVLPPAGRNYPAHVARGTASR